MIIKQEPHFVIMHMIHVLLTFKFAKTIYLLHL